MAHKKLITRHNGDYDSFRQAYNEIDAAMGRHGFLRHGWQEFVETLHIDRDPSTNPVRNTKRPGLYLNIDASESLHFLRSVPNYFVGFGLLFTFIGLAAAIYFASAGVASTDVRQAQESLQKLLDAATFKFLTSITGLAASLILSLTYRVLAQLLQAQFTSLCEALEKGMSFAPQESISLDILAELGEHSTQLKRFNTDFAIAVGDAVSQRMQESLNTLTAAINSMAKNMGTANQDALDKMTRDFGKTLQGAAGTEMKALTKSLIEIKNSLDTVVERIEQTSKNFSTRMDESTQQLENHLNSAGNELQDKAKGAADNLSTSLVPLQAQVDRFGSTVAQTSENFSKRMDESTRQVVEHLNSAGNELQNKAKGAADNLSTSLVPLQAQITRFGSTVAQTSENFSTRMDESTRQVVEHLNSAGNELQDKAKGAADNLSTSLVPLQAQITRFGSTVDALEGKLDNQRNAFRQVAADVQAITKETASTVRSLQTAVSPLASVSESLTAAAEKVGTAGATVSKTHGELTELAQTIHNTSESMQAAWENYQSRFKEVDEGLAGSIHQLTTGADAYRAQVGAFFGELVTHLDEAMRRLGGGIEGLKEAVEDLSEWQEQNRGTDNE